MIAPAIAGAGIFLNDDRGHAKPSQACTEPDATLSATDNHAIRLAFVTEFGFFLLLVFKPGLATLKEAVFDAFGSGRPFGFLVAF